MGQINQVDYYVKKWLKNVVKIKVLMTFFCIIINLVIATHIYV